MKRRGSSLQRELEQLEATDPNVAAAAKKYDEGVRAILARKPRMTTSDEAISTTTHPPSPHVCSSCGRKYRAPSECRIESGCSECGGTLVSTETKKTILARKPRMTTSDEAVPTTTQPTKPCHDCPFARTAINGWLGGNTKEEWSEMVRGEVEIPCHALKGPQCAGAAIMRGNMCKRPRDRSLLVLPPDRLRVFANTREFEEHHAKTLEKWKEALGSTSGPSSARSQVLELLDDLIAPGRMTRGEALEVVGDLVDDLEARVSAMRADATMAKKKGSG